MVIDDKFSVFEECCSTALKNEGMVEQTTIMNIILNTMKKVNDIPFLWESIWTEKALKPLLSSFFQQIKEFKNWT